MKRFIVMAALVLCSSLVSAQNTITCSIEEADPIIRTLELKEPGDYTFVLSGEGSWAPISKAMRLLPEGYNITLDCINVDEYSSLSLLNDIDSLVGIILPPYLVYADDFLNGCKNLTKVFIPATITTLPTFKGSPNVKPLIAAGNPHYTLDKTGKFIMSKDGKLLCRVLGKADTDSLYEILKEVTFIDRQAFLGNHLTSIKFPDNRFKFIDADSYYNEYYDYYAYSDLRKNALALTEIDPNTFEGCTALTNIKIPDGVTKIGESAFKGCTALAEISLPSTLTSIGTSAFGGCTALTNIKIPDSVTKIGKAAFWGCTALAEISLPSALTYIGAFAFESCTALARVTFHSNKRYDITIGLSAFSECSSLATISIPSNVTEIHSYAFFDCKSLSHVEISSYPKLENQVFGKCPQLQLTAPSDFKPPTNTFDDTPEPR